MRLFDFKQGDAFFHHRFLGSDLARPFHFDNRVNRMLEGAATPERFW